MIPSDQAEYDLLKLAIGEPATFSLRIRHATDMEAQAAFHRALSEGWITLIDITSNGSDAREIHKVFRLTDQGWYRRKVLEDKKT